MDTIYNSRKYIVFEFALLFSVALYHGIAWSTRIEVKNKNGCDPKYTKSIFHCHSSQKAGDPFVSLAVQLNQR